MSDFTPSHPDAGGVQAADARASTAQAKEGAVGAAATIGDAFDRAGASLARALARAASDGKVSLGELASAAISAAEVFARSSGSGAAIGGQGSLAAALGDLFKGLFGGGRADGGPVAPDTSYLVGERGPEVFRPHGSGEITPLGGGGGVTVNVALSGGAPALLRSEAQIAAALARAVSLGARA